MKKKKEVKNKDEKEELRDLIRKLKNMSEEEAIKELEKRITVKKQIVRRYKIQQIKSYNKFINKDETRELINKRNKQLKQFVRELKKKYKRSYKKLMRKLKNYDYGKGDLYKQLERRDKKLALKHRYNIIVLNHIREDKYAKKHWEKYKQEYNIDINTL